MCGFLSAVVNLMGQELITAGPREGLYVCVLEIYCAGLQFPFSIPSSDFAVFHLKPKIMKEAGSCPLNFGDLWCS